MRGKIRHLGISLAAALVLYGTPTLAQSIGTIKNVSAGDAEIIRDGETLRVATGFKVMEGDIIVTGPGMRVGVTLDDDTRMAVGPNSRIIISRYRFDRARRTGESVTRVDRGVLSVDSGALAKTGNMRVQTPTATLGVRGTRFVVEVQP